MEHIITTASTYEEQLADAVELLQASQKITVLTGAGISTESGIPDFRSPGSPWQKQPPVTFHAFLNQAEARRRYWETRRTLLPAVKQARPNAAHRALAELERQGRLLGLITQNFDGLHQDAGNSPERIVELHGTSREATCIICDTRTSIEDVQRRVDAGEAEPRCSLCGGYLKAATILFGQRIPDDVLTRAKELSIRCDLFLVVGSSLKVTPASHLPRLALQAHIPLIIINVEPTRLDQQADVTLHEKAGTVLPRLIALL
ncbi:NAD-dependent deacetylase [Thermosporothrix hazakensis]|jgi:NAD-dependent deacetylase|uniref:protein acetyllysine N-acetyltransferase n=2 Tax=Thermosporothrix TaxID=768650 RepID=A0A326UBK0_THEHA|nr:Sir2 family NAD-dependent protein deacetylase [Thermosporothrix hazakensis]PZW35982.1 NAD-dependent deacetylase [Thermosporothrix hazakensis]BBH88450.1 NAD-dependent protein deacetylase 2 [Thermosporothrix sp. COM3]GCE46636.1 NAD-dependent protein deacetylase 2 [Thermosporothrix hazakensis]